VTIFIFNNSVKSRPILIIFGTQTPEKICHQMTINLPTSPHEAAQFSSLLTSLKPHDNSLTPNAKCATSADIGNPNCRPRNWKLPILVVAILVSGCRPMSDVLGAGMSQSGIVENAEG